MSLVAAAQFAARQTAEVQGFGVAAARAGVSIGRAGRALAAGPDVTITVGPGGDASAAIYTRFFQRLQGGGVGDSAADAAAAAIYLSIFTAARGLTLPGYGIDPRALEFAVGYDPTRRIPRR